MHKKILLIFCFAFAYAGLMGCESKQEKEFQGYIDGDLTFIASQFAGILEKIFVQEGDSVKQNQPLLQLELEPQLSQLKQAKFELASATNTLSNLKKGERKTVVAGIEAEIAKAKSELELAEVRLNRAKVLYDKKLSNKDTLDAATTEYRTKSDSLKQLTAKLEEAKLGSREDVISAQEAKVQSAQAHLDELTWALESKKLNAPDEGYIYDVFFRQGEFVPNSKPILSMLSPLNQYIVFFVPINIMDNIKVKQIIKISCAGCKASYPATIFYISPKVEYTPPVIFSRQHQDKYVYRIHARLAKPEASNFHLGQPVFVSLKND